MITILIYVAAACLIIPLILIMIQKFIGRKIESSAELQEENLFRDLINPKKTGLKKKIDVFFDRLYLGTYRRIAHLPFVNRYVKSVRRKITNVHAYDEMTLRKQIMKIVYTSLILVMFTLLFLIFMNQDLLTSFLILLGALVIHGHLMHRFINRVEDRLMQQMSDLTSDVRYHFHRHSMVDEAIYDAAEANSNEVALHANRIYGILGSPEPVKALEEYYEVAPNRFLKIFAGLTFLTKEFGDKKLKDGSSRFLSALDKLKKEINLEIIRRQQLNYHLSFLTVIAVAPVLFVKPIEDWAKSSFPTMTEFYTSKLGFIMKLVIFLVILLGYILVKKLQETNEGKYVAKLKRFKWEKRLYEFAPIRFIVDRLMPPENKKPKLIKLLKESNSPLPLEWFYIHRIVLSVVMFIVLLSSFIYMHSFSAHNTLYAPTKTDVIFGELNEFEKEKAIQATDLDRRIILQMKGVKDNLSDRIRLAIQKEVPDADEKYIDSTLVRILNKHLLFENEYLKWWEFLIALLVGIFSYHIPVIVLAFQSRLRRMDMQNEVEQLHSIISMLSEIERISVETILEWMERFSTIFKEPLQKCLLHYDAGHVEALEQLKEDAPFTSFVRTVERLEVSVMQIPVNEAFEDLETDRAFNFEQRKQDYEKVIDSKKEWGRNIGFAPLYALVFLYLVLPLVYMSFTQMTSYYDKITNL
ncbi:hypothetical protein OM416_20300 [Paenibacillus sp. LS1]|uniref:hypothetical protein n=1 Tax=Paenibacillus sp. LS1 TaxID=2992120 RepID=UPI00222EC122|nr:hypothetical protein [Paenibacillus sp. LS1]MCW3793939.1 hypothetical protein [Paenibacillus sp. LS1]